MDEEIVQYGMLKGIKITYLNIEVIQLADNSCKFDLYKARLKARKRMFNFLLQEQEEYTSKLENAIRKHRDQRGDDKCWMDDEELYKVLPEGYTPPKRDTLVELKNCEKFIQCRNSPNTEYISPQRRIEYLENVLRENNIKFI